MKAIIVDFCTRAVKKALIAFAVDLEHLIQRDISPHLAAILAQLKEVTMNQQQAVDALNAVNATLDKIATESSASVEAINTLTTELAAALAAGGTITPELEAAINLAASKVANVDALVPDASAGPTPVVVATVPDTATPPPDASSPPTP